MKGKRLILVLFVAVSVAGCNSLDSNEPGDDLLSSYSKRAFTADESSGEKRVEGILHFHGDTAPVEVPETAVAGEPFEVTISTFGGGCDNVGSALVKVEGHLATIQPYDFTEADEVTVCTAILKIMPRTVEVTFDEPGEGVLRIKGLRVDEQNRDGVPEVIEKKISVVAVQ